VPSRVTSVAVGMARGKDGGLSQCAKEDTTIFKSFDSFVTAPKQAHGLILPASAGLAKETNDMKIVVRSFSVRPPLERGHHHHAPS
jgi:hypothetical protein